MSSNTNINISTEKIKVRKDNAYFLLSSLFIASLIVCNLIANKFITVDLRFIGLKKFVISAGVLPYPITFLITDLLSEIYGRKKTNLVVINGFIVSVFVLSILWFADQFHAIKDSPINDQEYSKMFSNSWRVVSASMVAYLSAQLIDVRLYHFWKDLTKGKHLWLRNNGSTIISQFVDTTLVVLVLFWGVKSSSELFSFIKDGWLFKAFCALLDTPIIYLLMWFFKKYLRLPTPN